MESLADIRPFVEAANLGGISAARRKLNLSPAAASARLVRLEAKLNVRLFERATRSLRLTEEGRRYLEHYQLAVQSLEDAHSALHVGQSVVRGRVRISVTSDFGRHVLKGWLDAFSKLYPDVVLSAALTDSKVHLLCKGGTTRGGTCGLDYAAPSGVRVLPTQPLYGTTHPRATRFFSRVP